jgi:hypothetical protein
MFAFMVSGYSLLTRDDLLKDIKMNSQLFRDVVLEETKQAVIAIPRVVNVLGRSKTHQIRGVNALPQRIRENI